MAEKLVANRPTTGRMLPPLAAVPGPTAMTGAPQGRTFEKTMKDLGQEQTYSRRILDNEKQQVKVKYERLKKKASQIRSNLTPEQIAEIQKGLGRGGTAERGKVELQNHNARVAAQRGRRISLDMTSNPAVTNASAVSPTSSSTQSRPKSAQAQPALQVPSTGAMGQKRVRKLATSAKPDSNVKKDTPQKQLPVQKPPLHSKKSVEDDKNLHNTSKSTMASSRPIPIPQTKKSDPLSAAKEEVMRKDRAATFLCSTTAAKISPNQAEQDIADILNRPRAISAFGRLQTTSNSSTKLPTVPEEVHRVYSPVTVRKFSSPCPPSRPKTPGCASSWTQGIPGSPEHRAPSANPNQRFGRKISTAGSPVTQRAIRRKSTTVNPLKTPNSAAIRSQVEPPAAFSCHEPKLEDVLARSSSAKNPAIRRISTVAAVSPFQESRARKREELREARIDDNELLAIELEQRKEKFLKGFEDIAGRPHEEAKDTAAPPASIKTEAEAPPSPPKVSKVEKRLEFGGVRDAEEDPDPASSWRREMMKIRYLRLPKDCEEVVTSEMLTAATAQHKAGSKWQNVLGK